MLLYNWMKYLISLYLVPYKYVTINFKSFPPPDRLKCIGKLLSASVNENLIPCIPFSILSLLYPIWISGINLKRYEDFLRQLECAQTDRQANQMHNLLSTLLESVKNHGTHLKIHFQPFRSIFHNVSEIFCVILYMKQAIVQL